MRWGGERRGGEEGKAVRLSMEHLDALVPGVCGLMPKRHLMSGSGHVMLVAHRTFLFGWTLTDTRSAGGGLSEDILW